MFKCIINFFKWLFGFDVDKKDTGPKYMISKKDMWTNQALTFTKDAKHDHMEFNEEERWFYYPWSDDTNRYQGTGVIDAGDWLKILDVLADGRVVVALKRQEPPAGSNAPHGQIYIVKPNENNFEFKEEDVNVVTLTTQPTPERYKNTVVGDYLG